MRVLGGTLLALSALVLVLVPLLPAAGAARAAVAAGAALFALGSFGLLRRREWARRLLGGLMAAAALAQIPAVIALSRLFRAFGARVAGVPGSPDMGPVVLAAILTGAAFAATIAWLCTWLALRLLHPRMRLESGR